MCWNMPWSTLATICAIVNVVPAGLQVVTPVIGVQVGESYSVWYSSTSWALVETL